MRVTRFFILVFAATVLLKTSTARAFPELTRHGYASCTSCHVSPNGGGVLTPYGRMLSREVLSSWGGERQAEIGHGMLPQGLADRLSGALETSKLRVGGDFRTVQTHRENSAVRTGQYFLMQAMLEAAWDEGSWAVVGSLGKIEDPRGRGVFQWYSPRYYALVRPTDKLNARAGRFSPAFGLNLADHTLSVRRAIGLGPEIDRDAIELSWLAEKDVIFLSHSITAQATLESDSERAWIGRYERVINDRTRVGASLWYGAGGNESKGNGFERFMIGLHSIVNISKDFFFSGEIDRQDRNAKGVRTNANVQSQYIYARMHYEPFQGVIPLLQWQHERTDINLDSSETNKYGFGVNWFPLPHFEVLGIWNRVKKPAEWSDEAYLMFHYYL